MTDAEKADRARSRQKADEDLSDIRDLRNSKPFNRYFLRRLTAKRDKLAETVLRDVKPTAEEREHLRRVMLGHEEVLVMMQQDEASASALLSTQRPGDA